MDDPLPLEIDRSGETEARILWPGGAVTVWPARELRLSCPCALCVDEVTGRRTLDPDTVPADVRLTGARLVGRYAVEFLFSDGHRNGFFSFAFLRRARPAEGS